MKYGIPPSPSSNANRMLHIYTSGEISVCGVTVWTSPYVIVFVLWMKQRSGVKKWQYVFCCSIACATQEVGGTFIGENGLVLMAGLE
jgi:hypothetical protein